MFDAVIVGGSSFNFNTLLTVLTQALGRNPAATADRCGRKLNDAERFSSILQCANDETAAATLHEDDYEFIEVCVLIGCDDFELSELVNFLPGLRIRCLETSARGVVLVVTIGTLNQWRDLITIGTNRTDHIQELACKLTTLFESAGYRLWRDCTRKPAGMAFRLEHKK